MVAQRKRRGGRFFGRRVNLETCHYYPPVLFVGCCLIPERIRIYFCGGANKTGGLRTQFVLQRATIQGRSMAHRRRFSRFAAHFILAVGSQSSDMTVGATFCEACGYRYRETALRNSCSCVMPAVIHAATCTAGKLLVRTQAALRRPTGCADDARDSAIPPRGDTFVPRRMLRAFGNLPRPQSFWPHVFSSIDDPRLDEILRS